MYSLWRTLDRGTLRDIALVCLADAVVGAAFGAIAVNTGNAGHTRNAGVSGKASDTRNAGNAEKAGNGALRRACVLGAVVAVAATPFLPTGLPVLLALTGLVLAARAPAGAEVP